MRADASTPLPTAPEQAQAPDALLQAAGFSLIPDAVRAAAYEAVPAQHRAWLKTTLALNRAVHGDLSGSRELVCTNARLGFSHVHATRPADWTLVVIAGSQADACDPAHTQTLTEPTSERPQTSQVVTEPTAEPAAKVAQSAARLAAALMCARLAGVDELFVLWPQLPAQACPAPLLTAIELAGIDESYAQTTDECGAQAPAYKVAQHGHKPPAGAAMSQSDWTNLLCALRAWKPHGRVLCCAQNPNTATQAIILSLEAAARSAGLPMWTDAQEQARGCPSDRHTAMFHDKLSLGAGCEGCWLHPDLTPDFFIEHSYRVARLEPDSH